MSWIFSALAQIFFVLLYIIFTIYSISSVAYWCSEPKEGGVLLWQIWLLGGRSGAQIPLWHPLLHLQLHPDVAASYGKCSAFQRSISSDPPLLGRDVRIQVVHVSVFYFKFLLVTSTCISFVKQIVIEFGVYFTHFLFIGVEYCDCDDTSASEKEIYGPKWRKYMLNTPPYIFLLNLLFHIFIILFFALLNVHCKKKKITFHSIIKEYWVSL